MKIHAAFYTQVAASVSPYRHIHYRQTRDRPVEYLYEEIQYPPPFYRNICGSLSGMMAASCIRPEGNTLCLIQGDIFITSTEIFQH
jgi:hypothetical protein